MIKSISPLYLRITLMVLFSLFMSFNTTANTLTMGLIGHIKDHCEINFESGNTITLYDEKPQTLPFDLYCNRPLGMTISSQYGGLKHEQNNLSLVEEYNITLQVDNLNIYEKKHSSQLINPIKIEHNPNTIPFLNKGILSVALEKKLIYAGTYKDIIEIDVYPSVNSTSN